MPTQTVLNLGGEGEEPSQIINQQPEWIAVWLRTPGDPLVAMVQGKTPLRICPNDARPFANQSIDYVYSNNVPSTACLPIDNANW